ncbi:hypothetical protein H0H81_005161 [Sphagnurus paluster]|uniref:Uncharacterized protein n=1 Tax=Sphagnurus paluster TaxID=117069 RepID=A0A9P7KI02_9AGAR|nr:hypothetical protein H0H81_005161 [Sphagnurus paluster]
MMVTPQALIRKAIMGEQELNVDLRKLSISSTGAVHESRKVAGHEQFKLVPDFVVYKFWFKDRPEDNREQRMLCLLEVKHNNESILKHTAKVMAYMRQVINHPLRDDVFTGYLIVGYEYKKFVLVGQGEACVVHAYEDIQYLSQQGDTFTEELCEISSKYWSQF